MMILVYFHESKYRTFKDYYLKEVCMRLRWAFPNIVSYSRFLELIPETLPLLWAYLQTRFGECRGISFIDSTAIKVCDNRRIPSHRVFQGVAKRSKTSVSWFYGFKLHLIINDLGELLVSVELTPGNTDDRKPVRYLTEGLFGKLFGDKGYISQELVDDLLVSEGIQLVSSIRKRMKNKFMSVSEKLLLKKRMLIESVVNRLKNGCQLEHSRHRSVPNFFAHVASALIAYTYEEKKPSLNLENSQAFKDLIAQTC
ncbi:IS982 family transposase [Candidatus Poribacteria bacterium]|nr:MAG: IS982 family transposase [Candidatus Poribacteria bacterium]